MRSVAVGLLPSLRFLLIAILGIVSVSSSNTRAVAQMPGQNTPQLPPVAVTRTDRGIHATVGSELLDITVCSDSVIHVLAKPDAAAQSGPQPWMLDAAQSCPGAPFHLTQDSKQASLKTGKLEITFGLERGNVTFRTLGGDELLR